MGRPAISSRDLTDTLTLSECHPTSDHRGRYWLYDKTVGMNLAMSAETIEKALLEALEYHQEQHNKYKNSYYSLKSRVDNFIESFKEDESLPFS